MEKKQTKKQTKKYERKPMRKVLADFEIINDLLFSLVNSGLYEITIKNKYDADENDAAISLIKFLSSEERLEKIKELVYGTAWRDKDYSGHTINDDVVLAEMHIGIIQGEYETPTDAAKDLYIKAGRKDKKSPDTSNQYDHDESVVKRLVNKYKIYIKKKNDKEWLKNISSEKLVLQINEVRQTFLIEQLEFIENWLEKYKNSIQTHFSLKS